MEWSGSPEQQGSGCPLAGVAGRMSKPRRDPLGKEIQDGYSSNSRPRDWTAIFLIPGLDRWAVSRQQCIVSILSGSRLTGVSVWVVLVLRLSEPSEVISLKDDRNCG